MTGRYPSIIATVLDAEDGPALAGFWCSFLGFTYRPGQGPGETPDFIVLNDRSGSPALAVQQVGSVPRPSWPDGDVSQQLHLDLFADGADDLALQVDRAISLGATVLGDRRTDADDPLVVLADPAGHPFCLIAPPAAH